MDIAPLFLAIRANPAAAWFMLMLMAVFFLISLFPYYSYVNNTLILKARVLDLLDDVNTGMDLLLTKKIH